MLHGHRPISTVLVKMIYYSYDFLTIRRFLFKELQKLDFVSKFMLWLVFFVSLFVCFFVAFLPLVLVKVKIYFRGKIGLNSCPIINFEVAKTLWS